MSTHYDALEIAVHARPEVVRAAYRALALVFHPDISKKPDAEERMKEINEAYEVLNDTDHRIVYNSGLGIKSQTWKEDRQRGGNLFNASLVYCILQPHVIYLKIGSASGNQFYKVLDAFKRSIPRDQRQWDPSMKEWTIRHTFDNVAVLRRLFKNYDLVVEAF